MVSSTWAWQPVIIVSEADQALERQMGFWWGSPAPQGSREWIRLSLHHDVVVTHFYFSTVCLRAEVHVSRLAFDWNVLDAHGLTLSNQEMDRPGAVTDCEIDGQNAETRASA